CGRSILQSRGLSGTNGSFLMKPPYFPALKRPGLPGILVKAVLSVILCHSFVIGSDWPQFLGPERNGVSTETGLLRTWTRKGPPLLWEKVVGAGFSGPVVAGERLILCHRVGDQEIVLCLDANTGKEKWNFAYP